MEPEPEKESDVNALGTDKPVIPPPFIPPPVISQPPPPPPSPMDGLPRSTPPPPPSGGEPAVNVRIRTGGEEDEIVPGGQVPLNTRLIAGLIDAVVVMGVLMLVGSIFPWLGWFGTWLLWSAYFLTRDSLPFLGGQSAGKKAMKIKAVTLDGQSLSGKWEQGAIRNASMVIPLVPLVELYLLLSRDGGPDRGRRLGDEWAKTKVIIDERPVPPGEPV